MGPRQRGLELSRPDKNCGLGGAQGQGHGVQEARFCSRFPETKGRVGTCAVSALSGLEPERQER